VGWLSRVPLQNARFARGGSRRQDGWTLTASRLLGRASSLPFGAHPSTVAAQHNPETRRRISAARCSSLGRSASRFGASNYAAPGCPGRSGPTFCARGLRSGPQPPTL